MGIEEVFMLDLNMNFKNSTFKENDKIIMR